MTQRNRKDDRHRTSVHCQSGYIDKYTAQCSCGWTERFSRTTEDEAEEDAAAHVVAVSGGA